MNFRSSRNSEAFALGAQSITRPAKQTELARLQMKRLRANAANCPRGFDAGSAIFVALVAAKLHLIEICSIRMSEVPGKPMTEENQRQIMQNQFLVIFSWKNHEHRKT